MLEQYQLGTGGYALYFENLSVMSIPFFENKAENEEVNPKRVKKTVQN
jgi:hypothetical protein